MTDWLISIGFLKTFALNMSESHYSLGWWLSTFHKRCFDGVGFIIFLVFEPNGNNFLLLFCINVKKERPVIFKLEDSCFMLQLCIFHIV